MPNFNQEWLTQNSLRNYPFKENASLVPNEDSDKRIPNSLIVDFILTCNSIPRVYLAELLTVGTYISLVFKDTDDAVVATVTGNVTAGLALDIVGTGDYGDTRGKIVFGDIDVLKQQFLDGAYTFTVDTAEMEPSTVRPMLRGVSSLIVVNNGVESEPIYGVVKLVAGINTKLTYVPADNSIRIDVTGEGGSYRDDCECEETPGGDVPCIKTINGINVEDIIIQGDSKCVEVTVSGNKLIISDVCSTPCCGCPELEFLSTELSLLTSNLANLENYSTALTQRLDSFIDHVTSVFQYNNWSRTWRYPDWDY